MVAAGASADEVEASDGGREHAVLLVEKAPNRLNYKERKISVNVTRFTPRLLRIMSAFGLHVMRLPTDLTTALTFERVVEFSGPELLHFNGPALVDGGRAAVLLGIPLPGIQGVPAR